MEKISILFTLLISMVSSTSFSMEINQAYLLNGKFLTLIINHPEEDGLCKKDDYILTIDSCNSSAGMLHCVAQIGPKVDASVEKCPGLISNKVMINDTQEFFGVEILKQVGGTLTIKGKNSEKTITFDNITK